MQLFEWDEQKSDRNFSKHGIRFEEAETVFLDPNSITLFDITHSIEENRYIDIGFSFEGRLLLVVYTERNSRIRIISARLCTDKEARLYDQG
ncbi:MAG: BrnT family toxin [Leptolyngbyaceae cyanobacterium RM2_2_4]|nr:BrnT family toxin [Leptolyngbyaceae cyanobacterium SM1_4_3]NJN89942.1 BrnT family toxin [Leptolyngbyaceae cyanobacterium SL_5_14]NJO53243.1 BrnT family toxin [Leptolyngbyaceae cyanobacterium RM2_2_4]NJO66534.1 BrnT family toxin [Leptolyngbyaceae cyanobacterium RM1_405_57]